MPPLAWRRRPQNASLRHFLRPLAALHLRGAVPGSLSRRGLPAAGDQAAVLRLHTVKGEDAVQLVGRFAAHKALTQFHFVQGLTGKRTYPRTNLASARIVAD